MRWLSQLVLAESRDSIPIFDSEIPEPRRRFGKTAARGKVRVLRVTSGAHPPAPFAIIHECSSSIVSSMGALMTIASGGISAAKRGRLRAQRGGRMFK